MSKLVAQSVEQNGPSHLIDLPHAPDFIIVEVQVNDAGKWPSDLNVSGQAGVIHIPIGLKIKRGSQCKDALSFGDKSELAYLAHAVDLAFAITVWKSQGGTFDYVIALLENSPNSPSLTFEMLYVMFSRVRLGSHFRCMPLTLPSRTKAKLKRLMPNIYATRWRMDVREFGKWVAHQESNTHCYEAHKPKAKRVKKAITKKKQEQRKQQQQVAAIKGRRANKTASTTTQTTTDNIKKRKQAEKGAEGPPKKVAKAVTGTKQRSCKQKRKLPKETNAASTAAFTSPPNHLPVLTCDDSPLYPHLQPPNSTQPSPSTSRVMSFLTGLPLRDTEIWGTYYFESRALTSLEPEEWLTTDPVELFSLLDCQTSNKVSYIPSCEFSLFKEHRMRHPDIPHPIMHHESRLHALQMLERPMWLSIVNHNNNHWQVLCIINHGTPNCLVLLMDSLAPSSNIQLVQTFASDYIDQVYLAAGQEVPVPVTSSIAHQCKVLRQPNGYDCGVFSLLNLKNAVYRVDEMLELRSLPVTSPPQVFDFCWWYGLLAAVHHRSYLHQRYQELLDLYSRPTRR
jgi:hypothetical protein